MSLEFLYALVAPVPRRTSEQRHRVVEGVLLEHIASTARLHQAWRRVRSNRGGPGGDHISLEQFAAKLDLNLARLSEALLAQTYRPARVRRHALAKPDGGRRWLTIPAVADRVAQTAASIALAPALDTRMSDASFAYRPGRSTAHALAEVAQAHRDGYVWALHADLRRYFDRVPHARLIDELAIWIDDDRIIRLFVQWLQSFSQWGRGVAQGSPISPLLANLYLHPVDRLLTIEGCRVVRYADDMLILTRDGPSAGQALKVLRRVLRGRELMLNMEKTRLIAPGIEHVFLGQSLKAIETQQPQVATS
jgi:CRISPR-associated protein Cas1